MKKLWNVINGKEMSPEEKSLCFLWTFSAIFALCGLLLWLGAHLAAGAGTESLILLVGYPLVFSWIPVFFYTCKNPFV